jgi:uncharacterized protein (DUF488 family)
MAEQRATQHRRSASGPHPRGQARNESPDFFTIGHSTRQISAFLGMLMAHGIVRIVDVRTVPRSRHNPQFDTAPLQASLTAAGIGYTHFPALGGLRRPLPDSVNTGWRNLAFRGFADHMQTPAFAAAMEQLTSLARSERVALMCAEAVPWRCHRSLIADALTVRGLRVDHILSTENARPHQLTRWAHVGGETITYPPPA